MFDDLSLSFKEKLLNYYLEFTGHTGLFKKRKSSLTSFKEHKLIISTMRPQYWCLHFAKKKHGRDFRNSENNDMKYS